MIEKPPGFYRFVFCFPLRCCMITDSQLSRNLNRWKLDSDMVDFVLTCSVQQTLRLDAWDTG